MVVSSFFSMLGWDVSDEKDPVFVTVARVLGVCIDLSDTRQNLVSVYNTDVRKAEIRDSIDKLLGAGIYKRTSCWRCEDDFFLPKTRYLVSLATLLWKLFPPLQNTNHMPHGAISIDLAASLKILRDRVVSSGPNKIGAGVRDVLHLYIDACFEPGPKAGIGGVLVDGNGTCLQCFGTWLDHAVIERMTIGDRETIILELEAFAILVGIHVFHNELCGCDTVIFCDNNSVMAFFISGKSALIANLTFQWEGLTGVVLWHETVPSHSNVADGPWRGHFDESLGKLIDAGRVSEVVKKLLNQCMSVFVRISNS